MCMYLVKKRVHENDKALSNNCIEPKRLLIFNVFVPPMYGYDSTVIRHLRVMFMFSKKATKIEEIFTVDLTLTT